MKTFINSILLIIAGAVAASANSPGEVESFITLKSPGNPAETYDLSADGNGNLTAVSGLPVSVKRVANPGENGETIVTVTITALEDVYYNFGNRVVCADYNKGLHTMSDEEMVKEHMPQFYMPGFWYRQNLRSPAEAPSFHTSYNWLVREDRLSAPLTGFFDEGRAEYFIVARRDKLDKDCLATHSHGDVILAGETSIGYTGFTNTAGVTTLEFGFPYAEAPRTYIRKLTLAPEVRAFEKLEAGKSRSLTWSLKTGSALTFDDFVSQAWNYSYDSFRPEPLADAMPTEKAKELLTRFYTQSYVDVHPLKYFSGIHMLTYDCLSNGKAEIGFIGRVLLNAFNALEYGESHGRPELVAIANSIFDSYLDHGFTPNGYFREFVDYDNNSETDIYSIRRQSEGAFAVLFYLDYERRHGRSHPQWEQRLRKLFDNFAALQNMDGSFPRKFDDSSNVKDASGGSTPSATLPLVMAYKYFGDSSYLDRAVTSGDYLINELILKSDYFSSTLDANCEDKEASLYASTAMYYLALVSEGERREYYLDKCLSAAYFCLSWYYLWDVPFAQGQMLGDVGFLSRGWGNVSVENNHIDVFIFEFAAVLDWLASELKNIDDYNRLSEMSAVIRSSMFQLMPVYGHMFDIAKEGYYPEVVQHTNWDYGKNGKGFYNDYFAPGWTVASLWQLLSPERVPGFFAK